MLSMLLLARVPTSLARSFFSNTASSALQRSPR
jgi:hypothetical protein